MINELLSHMGESNCPIRAEYLKNKLSTNMPATSSLEQQRVCLFASVFVNAQLSQRRQRMLSCGSCTDSKEVGLRISQWDVWRELDMDI